MKVSVAIAKQGIGYDIFGLISQVGLKPDAFDLRGIGMIGIHLSNDAVLIHIQTSQVNLTHIPQIPIAINNLIGCCIDQSKADQVSSRCWRSVITHVRIRR